MKVSGWSVALALSGLLAACQEKTTGLAPTANLAGPEEQMFPATGVVREIRRDVPSLLIQHEAIPNYMDAMTMPFKVKDRRETAGLSAGDGITFRLHVSATESWIDQVTRTGRIRPLESPPPNPPPLEAKSGQKKHPLLDFKFTNELGQAVSLSDFRGNALGITFFYTRCPLPEYCPRLSKNFQEVSQKLLAQPAAPTNWHLLSVSFDPASDTPAVLKAYGQSYQYDPAHWSFLTGPANEIGELAALSDVKIERDGYFFSHNFRTLVIDPAGHLQMSFPVGGDISDDIVQEILKAAAVTNR